MKYLSLKILILCILLPPVLYTFSIISIESYLENEYRKEVEAIYIGSVQPLFDGTRSLKHAVNGNIERYLKTKKILSWGVDVLITVTTERGGIIYPAEFELDEPAVLVSDPVSLASENYHLLDEGLNVAVHVQLDHNVLLSNLILGCYIVLSLCFLSVHYRSAGKKAAQEDDEKFQEIHRLFGQQKEYEEKMTALAKQSATLKATIEKSKKQIEIEREKASRSEEEMLKEIIVLEDKLEQNFQLQEHQQKLINQLEVESKKLIKEKQKTSRQKQKESETIKKRFYVLYKNLNFHDRAVTGFSFLEEEMKIKAEELIHQLNSDPKQISVKRKVFGKKGMETIFEILFAYKGRLYFRNMRENKIEILAVGTKNTQNKDLEFLSNF